MNMDEKIKNLKFENEQLKSQIITPVEKIDQEVPSCDFKEECEKCHENSKVCFFFYLWYLQFWIWAIKEQSLPIFRSESNNLLLVKNALVLQRCVYNFYIFVFDIWVNSPIVFC